MSLNFLKPRLMYRYKDLAVLLFTYARSDVFDVDSLYSIVEEDRNSNQDDDGRPEQMARDLEAMGPTFVKLGQVLSSRPDLVSPPYMKALGRLKDQVEPVPIDHIRDVIQKQLGTRPAKLFEAFDEKPLASASLGQVHRATLRGSGREVVVKVQRPAIRNRIATDLEALETIAELMDANLKKSSVGFVDLVRQFRQTLAVELDYRQEARHLSTFARNLEEFDSLVIPRPVESHTTERVLTMDFVAGTQIGDLNPVALIDVDGNNLAEDLIRAYLKQILVDGMFHADPHAGNVFLTRDHRIALIDFGMVGFISEQRQDQFLSLVLDLAEGRGSDVADRALDIGKSTEHDDSERFRREIAVLVSRHKNTTVGQLKVGALLLELYQLAAVCGISVPPEISLLGKTLAQLEEIVGGLAPDLDTAEVIRKQASRSTATRMADNLSPGNLLSTAVDFKRLISKAPADLGRLLDRMVEGDLRLVLDHEGVNDLSSSLQAASNRIAASTVIAALIVGAALLMRVETSFRVFGYPGLAILLFLLAAGCGLWLLWSIFTTPSARPKRE